MSTASVIILLAGSLTNQAPLVLLIHDWDGLTDYKVKRRRHYYRSA